MDNKLAFLFDKYLHKSASEAERAELGQLLSKEEHGPELDKLLQQAWFNFDEEPAEIFSQSETIIQYERIKAMAGFPQDADALTPTGHTTFGTFRRVFRPKLAAASLKTTWFRYAAMLILVSGFGIYYWLINRQAVVTDTTFSTHNSGILTGRDGAVLTLADGSTIILDSSGNRIIATQNGVNTVVKDGQLSYQSERITGKQTGYNTVTTPKGRQYKVVLPDDTKVWLNAASSITYPIAFTGNDRIVTITGEAYFEVSSDPGKPFKVNSTGQQVAVLGTDFNINAYEDENGTQTTLLAGSVQILPAGGGRSGSATPVLLTPGYQCALDHETSELRIVKADVKAVIAWKAGTFLFQEADIRAVMRQVARWYNVQISYKGNLSDVQLSGALSRKNEIGELLRVLEMTKRVRFVTAGDQVTVLPY